MQQNPQMAAMANMGANPGPVDGTPLMGNAVRSQRTQGSPNAIPDPRENLNTYIYDYFLRNNHHKMARIMLESNMNMQLQERSSPSGANVNGVDGMNHDSKDELPTPKLPPQQLADNSFLLDWWVQFWDIYSAHRTQSGKGLPYIAHTRALAQMSTEQRNQRMLMNQMNPAQYNAMMQRQMPNGMNPNAELQKRAAMNSRNPNAMANMGQGMNQMNKQALMSAQMQRDGSGMDMNGQRPSSPGSAENAPSPNKRPRVEGGMNPGNMPSAQFNEFAQQNAQDKNIQVYAQNLAQQQKLALNNSASVQGMNSGVQGSPMNQQGLDGQHDMFAGNHPRAAALPGGAPGQAPQGNHALQDYQMQLMLLEQQNKKRLLMARQEQDNISGPHAGAVAGGPAFQQSMSPSGSRAGPSPNPADQMKRGTPKMPQQGLPGSPMPDAAMQGQRNSPVPNMNFEQMPPGVPPQFYPQMPHTPMMRPPSSHPGGNFNGQQMTPQQMEAMRQNGNMPNGAWQGQPRPNMMPNQQQMGPMAGNNPQQRGQMPPPPAPAGEQPRTQEPSPSQPAQAPPTPSSQNKPNPKKKPTKDNKKPAKKGANAGATPATTAGEEPPTPTTPMHKNSFNQNGQPPPAQPPAQPQPPAASQQQPPAPMDNNGGPPFGTTLDNDNGFMNSLDLGFDGENLGEFDFDSFLHVGEDNGGFGNFATDLDFNTVEAGDGM